MTRKRCLKTRNAQIALCAEHWCAHEKVSAAQFSAQFQDVSGAQVSAITFFACLALKEKSRAQVSAHKELRSKQRSKKICAVTYFY